MLLDLADFQRQAGAPVEQRQQFAIDAVDSFTQRQQRRLVGGGRDKGLLGEVSHELGAVFQVSRPVAFRAAGMA